MNTATARVLGIPFVVSILTVQVARGEVFEVPLPVTGEYTVRQRREFAFDLGVELAEVHSVAFRSQGTIVAPLDAVGTPPYQPTDGLFIATLLDQPLGTVTHAYAPPVGRETYPAPAPFSGSDDFGAVSWEFLLDGKAGGMVWFGHSFVRGTAVFGQGVLTSATLVVDATPVPEPGILGIAVGAVVLRRRRAGNGARYGSLANNSSRRCSSVPMWRVRATRRAGSPT